MIEGLSFARLMNSASPISNFIATLAFLIKSINFFSSFFPSVSTPDAVSTAYGRTHLTASITFVGFNPPANITGMPAFRTISELNSQLCTTPVPPVFPLKRYQGALHQQFLKGLLQVSRSIRASACIGTGIVLISFTPVCLISLSSSIGSELWIWTAVGLCRMYHFNGFIGIFWHDDKHRGHKNRDKCNQPRCLAKSDLPVENQQALQ